MEPCANCGTRDTVPKLCLKCPATLCWVCSDTPHGLCKHCLATISSSSDKRVMRYEEIETAIRQSSGTKIPDLIRVCIETGIEKSVWRRGWIGIHVDQIEREILEAAKAAGVDYDEGDACKDDKWIEGGGL